MPFTPFTSADLRTEELICALQENSGGTILVQLVARLQPISEKCTFPALARKVERHARRDGSKNAGI